MNFAACLEVKEEEARFSRLMVVSVKLTWQWRHFAKTPSFQKVLEICYAAGISPLQLFSDTAGMREEVYVHHYRTFEEAQESLQTFLEDIYNAKRLHSSLDYVPPDEFELQFALGQLLSGLDFFLVTPGLHGLLLTRIVFDSDMHPTACHT